MDVFYTKGNSVKVNLTKMFGEGNEPTPEEFESMFPKSYHSYEEVPHVSIIKLILLKILVKLNLGEETIKLALCTDY